jgi:hypothetical protein
MDLMELLDGRTVAYARSRPQTSTPSCACTLLLEHLAHRARTEGVTRFVADTLGDNHRMLGVFRRSGLMVGSETQAGVVHVVLDLRLGVPA